ncbi:MAG: DUF5714 domain-containing protein [Planctomycetota bacterium]
MAFAHQQWHRHVCGDTAVYVDPATPHWFVPDAHADALLQRLATDPHAPLTTPEALFLRRLPVLELPPHRGRADALGRPHLRELWFHLTDRCNLGCRHCLFASSPGAERELDAATVHRRIDQAYAMGCRVFAFTGGEPFVHPQWRAIVDDVLDRDGTHVAVLTNGMLFDDFAADLARWPAERLHLQVSIDGLQPAHDALRGAGSFVALRPRLQRLCALGHRYTLSMCVTQQNLADMAGVVELGAELGAGNIHYMWYFVRGRATTADFVPPAAIADHLLAAGRRAAAVGLQIDNLAALAGQVFTPPGTRHDGTNAGWQTMAIGPDGRGYPTPATVGLSDLGFVCGDELAATWADEPLLTRIRAESIAGRGGDFDLLLGGGDFDHSYYRDGSLIGADPYEELHRRVALELIAAAADAVPVPQGVSGPRLRLKMGEKLVRCGEHGAVCTTHSNCLLALAADSRASVRDFYTSAATETNTDILNPACYPEADLAHIPAAYRFRGYGCGSPVADAELVAGETVLDLGCGTGVECFIASRRVGADGAVIGVDMLEPMLARARAGAAAVATSLGYTNLDFRNGLLESLPVTAASVDCVISNCVLNLSTDKRLTFAEIRRVLRPGGRMVVSDVVSDVEIDPVLANDPEVRGQCLGGALVQKDLVGLLRESGFVGFRIIRRSPYREAGGQRFHSLTFVAVRPLAGSTRRVQYRGPLAAGVTPDGTLLPVGQTVELTAEEATGLGEAVLELDDAGAVTNLDFDACSCCSPAAAGSADENCCSPGDAIVATEATDCCSSAPEAPALAGAAATAGSCGCAGDAPATSGCGCAEGDASASGSACGEPAGASTVAGGGAQRHTAGCMVCGAPLIYLESSADRSCSYCGKTLRADAVCTAGHFVCDGCHSATGLAWIENVAAQSKERDMIAVLERMRAHASFPVHGPEHHALVPAAILTAWRNAGGPIAPEQMRAAIRRGAAVAGGSCGLAGACGAAVGVGVAFATISGSTPYKADERQVAMEASAAAMAAIARYRAARCCQRESWIALRVAAQLAPRLLGGSLPADQRLVCSQVRRNPDCLGPACPIHPATAGRDAARSCGCCG